MPEPAAPAQGEREESNTQKWIKIGQVRSTNYIHVAKWFKGKASLFAANIVDMDSHAARYVVAQLHEFFPKSKN